MGSHSAGGNDIGSPLLNAILELDFQIPKYVLVTWSSNSTS